MEGLGTIVEQIGTEEREIPNSINAATKDTKTQDGESQVETAEQMPPIATSRKKNMLKKSKEIILPQPSLPSPRPSPLSKSVHTTPFFPDPLDFFSSTSATPGIASTPVITKPEKRKFKPESTKIDITNKPKTKKKKKGNVIDDLFEGLI
ncbi:hypothetical protein L211DRAFT_836735 [Terfezia boudieri ATCC MYA-4762]|uniref:Uncharacterized protein n=1 Tax=Terfezia boudieri ATCC MYA-4762 TaxID=1051890 RepID=A0A3N4LR36_9PEZI|nr:hypothetical protein L211DRAFT_836735 [Terfezia boudieri ATCC MYA-4762]